MFKKLKRSAEGAMPPQQKSTAGLATTVMPLPEKIVLLMNQHSGQPSVPVVKKGDTVKVGSLVGKASGAISAHIHSGVSGTVKSVEPLQDTTGKMVEAVIIEPDGQQEIDPAVLPPAVRDRESFLQAVEQSGLVGLGGAGFPTAVKLSVPGTIDTLIINGAECEPYITSDTREMLESGDMVLSGIMAVKKYLNIPKAIIAIERNKPEAMDLMFSLTKGDPGLQVLALNTRYPQGAERVLIYNATGKEVPAGKFPADVGVLMLNVSTVSAIGKYLATGMPLMRRRITVDGHAVVEPKNVDVVIGTPIADVIEFCGGYKFPPAKILTGGPMMGIAMVDESYPITKHNNALLAFTEEEAYLPKPGPCIRCGRCISACPVGLSPVEICESYEADDWQGLAALSADLCISCGCCSYVCPAKRLVSQTTTLGREAYWKGANKNAGK